MWYPADARNDPGLAACSIHTRAVWRLLIDVMHETEERGYLVVNGKAMTEAQIAHALGASRRTAARHLNELETHGVFSRDERGAIYCRRMVKDEAIRLARVKAGKLGGNPNLVKQKPKDLDNQTPPVWLSKVPTSGQP